MQHCPCVYATSRDATHNPLKSGTSFALGSFGLHTTHPHLPVHAAKWGIINQRINQRIERSKKKEYRRAMGGREKKRY